MGERDSAAEPGLLQLWREDLRSHDGDWTLPGFRALAVHRFGARVASMSARTPAQRAARRLARAIHRSAERFVRNRYRIVLPHTAHIGRRFRVVSGDAVVVHRFAQIGDDCVIRQAATIGAAGRGVHRETAPVLEDGVDIGPGAMVLGHVRVGAGARIGPKAVILMDVPAGALAVAPAARVATAEPA